MTTQVDSHDLEPVRQARCQRSQKAAMQPYWMQQRQSWTAAFDHVMKNHRSFPRCGIGLSTLQGEGDGNNRIDFS